VGSDGDDDWESVALGGALKILFSLLFFLPNYLLFSSILLTSVRSCNGHAPLIIQEGRDRAGQIPQPRLDGQSPDPDSSEHSKGRKERYLY
jgi:hypothetical protein